MKITTFDSLLILTALAASCSKPGNPESVRSQAAIPPPQIVTEPADVNASPGEDAVFQVEVKAGQATFQWYHNQTAIAGATNRVLSLKGLRLSDTGDFHVVVHGEGGRSTISRLATLLLYSAPLAAIQIDQAQFGAVKGRVAGVDASNFGLLCYIKVFGGWWSKPTFAAPMTSLLANGAFLVPTVTGANDSSASEVRLFLVPANSPPILADGKPSIPSAVNNAARAEARAVKEPEFAVAPVILRQPVGGQVALGDTVP